MMLETTTPLHPGITLEEHLEYTGMSQKELSERTGLSTKTINQIIKGKAPVTHDTSIKLERVTGIPATLWNNLENAYREDLLNKQDQENLEKEISYVKSFTCYKQLIKLGLVNKTTDSKEKIDSILRFLQIESMSFFNRVYESFAPNFRISKKNETSLENVVCWIKAGERIASLQKVEEYKKSELKRLLPILKAKTKELEDIDTTNIIKLLNSVGVRCVFIEHFEKAPINGIARLFLGNPLIQISYRYKRLDVIWFTLFHEIGHVYLGHLGKDKCYIDIFQKDKSIEDTEESEADKFAMNTMIPSIEYSKLISKRTLGEKDVIEFSEKIGIGPNIVAGRIAYDFNKNSNRLYEKVSRLRPTLSKEKIEQKQDLIRRDLVCSIA